MSEGPVTTDHEKIRKWVGKRGGHAATVKGREEGDEAGILRIDFDSKLAQQSRLHQLADSHTRQGGVIGDDGQVLLALKDERLDWISWDEFFKKFDEAGLAFVYQDKTADGKTSRFQKFIRRSESDKQH